MSPQAFNTFSLTGLVGGGLAIVVGALLFPPLAVLGLLALIGAVALAAVVQARVRRRWGLVWGAGAALLIWVVASTIAWTAWGQAFDLSDANKQVPVGLSATLKLSALIGLGAFAASAILGVIATVRARRVLRPRSARV